MSKRPHNKIDKKELERLIEESTVERLTLSFYRYHRIAEPEVLRNELYRSWEKLGILGRIYIASEGINAQLSVPKENFSVFRQELESITWLRDLRLNIALEDDGKSFSKLIIKVRSKIVADGLDDKSFDPSNSGDHLDAASFNQLAATEGSIIVDMRNHYESEVGHFKGAVLPDADTFREALEIAESELQGSEDNPILMYCTGGIRCEKASAWFKHKGFKNVYQLDGGIINYSRQVEQSGLENKFVGKNFVFDRRLGERVSEDVISVCHQCGAPCDTHVNCANEACHQLFIQCEACSEKLEACCSEACQEFIHLPEEEQKEQRKGGAMKKRPMRKGKLEPKN